MGGLFDSVLDYGLNIYLVSCGVCNRDGDHGNTGDRMAGLEIPQNKEKVRKVDCRIYENRAADRRFVYSSAAG